MSKFLMFAKEDGSVWLGRRLDDNLQSGKFWVEVIAGFLVEEKPELNQVLIVQDRIIAEFDSEDDLMEAIWGE